MTKKDYVKLAEAVKTLEDAISKLPVDETPAWLTETLLKGKREATYWRRPFRCEWCHGQYPAYVRIQRYLGDKDGIEQYSYCSAMHERMHRYEFDHPGKQIPKGWRRETATH